MSDKANGLRSAPPKGTGLAESRPGLGQRGSGNTGPYIAAEDTYIAADGTMGQLWAVVSRRWDTASTAWQGIAITGVIASSQEHAIRLLRMNGDWPPDVEFRAYPPGHPMGEIVWGS